MRAFGPLLFAVAVLAVGTVLVREGHDVAGLALDLLGVAGVWSAFWGPRS